MRLTRRELAAALASGATAAAQSPASALSPEEALKAARERIRANGEALAKERIPVETEPSFQFRA
jgi:hypothetical protein